MICLDFLKKNDILKVVEKLSSAWEQIRPETLRKSWQKLIQLKESSPEEIAVCSEKISLLNDDFVEKFAAINIILEPSDIDGWFQNDGPGYEHLNTQGIMDLVIAPADNIQNEEDADENANFQTKKTMSSYLCKSHAKA